LEKEIGAFLTNYFKLPLPPWEDVYPIPFYTLGKPL